MKYKNILVPIDFSKTNKAALVKALELQSDSNAELTLAHIVDYIPPPYVRPELPEIFASDELMLERADEHMNTLIAELDIQGCHKISQTGKTKTRLLEIIENKNIDLVVMAKHSQSGLDRLIGSVTNTVVQKAHCDVLVIHE